MKTVYVLRHANAEPATGAGDAARSLSIQGEREARSLLTVLAKKVVPVDVVLCSDAVRTRETLDCVRKSGFFEESVVHYPAALYNAPAAILLQHIRELPESYSSVLVVGHNPGIHELTMSLAATGTEAAMQALAQGMSPCTFGSILFEAATWDDIDAAGGALEEYWFPSLMQRAPREVG